MRLFGNNWGRGAPISLKPAKRLPPPPPPPPPNTTLPPNIQNLPTSMFQYSPFNAFRLFLGSLALCYRNGFLWNETQSRMDAFCSVFGTFSGSGPRMNLEMHLHLNSEFVSNEFRTECALNLDLKSERCRWAWI